MTRRRSGSGRAYSQIRLSICCKYSFSKTAIPCGSNNMPKEAGMAMMALVHSKDDKKARVAAGQARQGKAGGTSSSSLDLPTGVACHTSTTTNPPQPAPLAPQISMFVATDKGSPLAPEMNAFFCARERFLPEFHTVDTRHTNPAPRAR